jgi:ribosomal protein S18 acetylase RimI-like enzyme
LKDSARQQASAFLVAEHEGKCVGMAFVLLNVTEIGDGELQAYSHAHVNELGVLSSARGMGIASALLDECERRAAAQGQNEITLSVYAGNDPARKLYFKSGYEDLKVRMRKTIDPK